MSKIKRLWKQAKTSSTRSRRDAIGHVRRDLRILRERLRPGARRLPDTIVIGAQKAGTTTLYDALVLNPKVTGSYFKEVHFFDTDYDRGVDWYALNFPPKSAIPDDNRVIEASPYYLFHPDVPARISNFDPEAKILAILRDPVARALSHYHHEHRKGFEPIATPREAFAAEAHRMAATKPGEFAHRHYSYVSRGLYARQLKPWFDAFGQDGIHVSFLEEVVADRQKAFDEVAKFLEIPSHTYPDLKSNSGEYRPMDTEEERDLTDYFRDDVAELEELLGRQVPWERFRR